jgi:hypothetical protein
MSTLDASGLTAASESTGNAHELAVQSGHCIAVASGLLDLRLEAPRSEHAVAAPALIWTQLAEAHTGCLTLAVSAR